MKRLLLFTLLAWPLMGQTPNPPAPCSVVMDGR